MPPFDCTTARYPPQHHCTYEEGGDTQDSRYDKGHQSFSIFCFSSRVGGESPAHSSLGAVSRGRTLPSRVPDLWDCAIHKYKEQAGKDILITGVDYRTFYNAPASQEPLWRHGIPRSRSVIWASSNMRSELHDENPKQITHSSKAPV